MAPTGTHSVGHEGVGGNQRIQPEADVVRLVQGSGFQIVIMLPRSWGNLTMSGDIFGCNNLEIASGIE